MSRKISKKLAKEVEELRQLFTRSDTPWLPIPMPKRYRQAARHLERAGFLISEDALRKPGSPNVVRGYMRPNRPDQPTAVSISTTETIPTPTTK